MHVVQRALASGQATEQAEPEKVDRRRATRRADSSNIDGSPVTTRLADLIQRDSDGDSIWCRTAGLSIQRVPTDDSHPDLVEHYAAMMKSSTFKGLAEKVERHRRIRLLDSSDANVTDYDSKTHTIRIPKRQNPAELRSNLVFEMHNAASKFNDLFDTSEERGKALEAEDPGLVPYALANRALGLEWQEWLNAAESHFRGRQIDVDLGGNQIFDKRSRSFRTPGEGWFKFSEYLDLQITSGHISSYDPNAKDTDWVGRDVLSDAQEEADKSAFLITEDELVNFSSGASGHLKNPSDNPFITLSGQASPSNSI